MKNGWFKPATQWEQVDMDKDTVLRHDNLSAEDLMYWQRRAFASGRCAPGRPDLHQDADVRPQTFKRTVRVGLEHFSWMWGSTPKAGRSDVKPLAAPSAGTRSA